MDFFSIDLTNVHKNIMRDRFSIPIIVLLVLSQSWAGMVKAEDNLVLEKTSSDIRTDNKFKAHDLDLKPRLPDVENTTSKVIMVPPGTERVIVQQSNYEFKEEAKSFRRFRWHYMAFFSMFFTMMVINVSWDE